MSALTEPAFEPPPPPPTPPAEPKAPRPTYLLPVAIGVFVLGVLFAVGAIAKFTPGAWPTAIGFCVMGLLLAALCLIRLPAVPKKDDQPLSLLQKVTGIFFEPSRVFRNLREYPLWIGAFVIIGALSSIYGYAFVHRITPERIIEQSRRQMESLGTWAPPPEIREAQLEKQLEAMKSPASLISATLNSFPLLFILLALTAALSLVGILAFGGRINFWQAFAVTVYAAFPVVVVQKVLGLLILYLKNPDDLHPVLNRDTTLQDNLGILFSPADHPILFVMASFIGLTSIYGLWLRAKGLHLGATRASSGAGWGVAITLWVLLILFVVTITALFPASIS
ncbi:MAG TPA: YIP1 family protein [Pyrinomonadaceae bacterium]|nr:YIP1 family protein [Pyrinomonadaceae bacterium]